MYRVIWMLLIFFLIFIISACDNPDPDSEMLMTIGEGVIIHYGEYHWVYNNYSSDIHIRTYRNNIWQGVANSVKPQMAEIISMGLNKLKRGDVVEIYDSEFNLLEEVIIIPLNIPQSKYIKSRSETEWNHNNLSYFLLLHG